MNINEIINEYGIYSPIYDVDLTNHLPMVQLALFRMCEDEKKIRKFSDFYVKEKDLVMPNTTKRLITSITDGLGNRRDYLNYYDYYLNRLENEEVGVVVKEVINQLSKGLGSGLFHGIIRLSYALEENNIEEISRSLAFYSCIYSETIFTDRRIPKDDVKEELLKVVLTNSENNFYIDADIDEKEVELLENLVDLYFSTGSFVVLHTITGFHALMELKPLYDNYNEVFDRYTVCVQRALLRVSEDSFVKIVVTHVHENWKELFELACKTFDSHTIKFVYSCYRLEQMFNIKGLINIANIKLKMDDNL